MGRPAQRPPAAPTARRTDAPVTAGRVEDLDATAWWLAVLLALLVMARNVLVWVDHTSDRRPVRVGCVG